MRVAALSYRFHKPLWLRARCSRWGWKPELRGCGSDSSPHECVAPRGGGNIEPGGGKGGIWSPPNGGSGGDLWRSNGGSKCGGDIGGGGEPVFSYLPPETGGRCNAGGGNIGGGDDNLPPRGGGRWLISYGGRPEATAGGKGGRYGGKQCR